MKNAIIKVIKKSSAGFRSEAAFEKAKVKHSPKAVVLKIEDNIKNWIAEVEARKHDELIQAHTLFGEL